MELVKKGKTKDVYELENGNYLLKFKDDVTGTDGEFDPGANEVGLSIEGMGNCGLRLTAHFFKLLHKSGVKTHLVNADIDNNTMEVLPAIVFGNGMEVICRFRAAGSFVRRYGDYVKEGQSFAEPFVEVTLKDDERGDPPITKDALDALGIVTNEEYESLKSQTIEICTIVKEELAKHGCELFDIKLEFGITESESESEVILIDEISGGNMRAYKGGSIVAPLQLAKIVLG
ncbi:MAG: phosphoribosylaminoimidazolesuccinocarboxamide synthase [Oscillospiraceae bacterium]|nr:phosphoribosylaminoimidazolesuccinocarboxamide synthase [Oscillospiraceae bacterium]